MTFRNKSGIGNVLDTHALHRMFTTQLKFDTVAIHFPISYIFDSRVFMLLSCIGQRSLSNSGVLEGLLNLLDSLLSPLQQPQAAAQPRTEGKASLMHKICMKTLQTSHMKYSFVCVLLYFPGVLDIPMISWVVMLISRLLDYVASIDDEASGGKKNLGGKERERTLTGTVCVYSWISCFKSSYLNHSGPHLIITRLVCNGIHVIM